MRIKYISDSGFLTRRAFAALLMCAVTCFVLTRTLPAFFQGQAPANIPQRILTFAERVAYQRAIEEVYWRHRIWPKERPDPKPSIDAVMSQAQLEKKVTDYLRKSQALEDYWQRPITAEQLQAEMDRMAKHTRQPEVLRELFEALGSDSFIIAECLGRPALADRLLTNWYAYDQRIHGELKRRAEAELQAHNTVEQIKEVSENYSEIILARADSSRQKSDRAGDRAVTLNRSQWDGTVERLSAALNNTSAAKAADVTVQSHGRETAAFRDAQSESTAYDSIPVAKLSSLQEDESRYYATAVIEKRQDHLKLATISWAKEPLQSWLARRPSKVSTSMAAPMGHYALPSNPAGSGCIDDTWTAMSGPPDGRVGHTAVWTGSEMLIWGGSFSSYLNSGGKYDPSTDSWTAINATSAPSARTDHTAVWTGTEMIVWGGINENLDRLNTGGRYNPRYRQLDSYQHHQRARWAQCAYGDLEWQRNDYLGRLGGRPHFQHRRQI